MQVPRYILLIKEMLRHNKNEETRTHLQRALVAMETAATNMNVTIKHHETHVELSRLEEVFQMRVGLVKPGRSLIKEGMLRKCGSVEGKSMFGGTLERRSLFLLFNDMFLCASDHTLGPSRMRFAVPLHLLHVIEEGFQGTPNFRIVTPSKDMVLQAESEAEAQDWIQQIGAQITGFKNNPDLEKRSTEAELEFTLKRNPAKMGDIAIMSQYMEHVVNNEDSINAATSTIASGTFQSYVQTLRGQAPSSNASTMNSSENSPRDLNSELMTLPSLSFAASLSATTFSPRERVMENNASVSMSMSRATTASDGYGSGDNPEPTMQGYLSKRGDGIKTWKRRFFVVDTKFKLLRYFKDEEVFFAWNYST
jgi:hypothetical protein